MRIELVKTKQGNAIVSGFDTELFDKYGAFDVVDSSDKNWRTSSRCCHNVNEAFDFLRSRGYRYVVTENQDGDRKYVLVEEFRHCNKLY